MPFQTTIDAFVNEHPVPTDNCYLCNQRMVPFDLLDQNEDHKQSPNDPTMTAYLPCCLQRCHEFCLGKSFRDQCAAKHLTDGPSTSLEPTCRACAEVVHCPGCGTRVADINHVWNADAAASNSAWYHLTEPEKRKQERKQYQRRNQARRYAKEARSKARVDARVTKTRKIRHISAREHNLNARRLVGQITKAIARANREDQDDIEIITDALQFPASFITRSSASVAGDNEDEMMDAGSLF